MLYVSLGCNHSNPKVTRIDKMLSADCVEGLYATNKAILFLQYLNYLKKMKSFLSHINVQKHNAPLWRPFFMAMTSNGSYSKYVISQIIV